MDGLHPRALKSIEKHGLCLVFPIDNSKQFPSLWYDFYPRSKMRWEWDDSGDNRVGELWHLREELSRSGKVVYAKWFKGRATFFSKDCFVSLLKELNPHLGNDPHMPKESAEMLAILEDNSPLSTKALKRACALVGKDLEPTFVRASKYLWEHLLIVGVGEVDDGAFPSLAISSTKAHFETLWRQALKSKKNTPSKQLALFYEKQPWVKKQVERILKGQKRQLSKSGALPSVVDWSFFSKP